MLDLKLCTFGQTFILPKEHKLDEVPGFTTSPFLTRMFMAAALSVAFVSDRNPSVCHSGSLEIRMLFT